MTPYCNIANPKLVSSPRCCIAKQMTWHDGSMRNYNEWASFVTLMQMLAIVFMRRLQSPVRAGRDSNQEIFAFEFCFLLPKRLPPSSAKCISRFGHPAYHQAIRTTARCSTQSLKKQHTCTIHGTRQTAAAMCKELNAFACKRTCQVSYFVGRVLFPASCENHCLRLLN